LAVTSQPQPEPFLFREHWRPAELLGPSWINWAVFTLAESIIDQQIG
jgi:hypothetical protein